MDSSNLSSRLNLLNRKTFSFNIESRNSSYLIGLRETYRVLVRVFEPLVLERTEGLVENDLHRSWVKINEFTYFV